MHKEFARDVYSPGSETPNIKQVAKNAMVFGYQLLGDPFPQAKQRAQARPRHKSHAKLDCIALKLQRTFILEEDQPLTVNFLGRTTGWLPVVVGLVVPVVAVS